MISAPASTDREISAAQPTAATHQAGSMRRLHLTTFNLRGRPCSHIRKRCLLPCVLQALQESHRRHGEQEFTQRAYGIHMASVQHPHQLYQLQQRNIRYPDVRRLQAGHLQNTIRSRTTIKLQKSSVEEFRRAAILAASVSWCQQCLSTR